MFFYSSTTNAFYLNESRENYEAAGTWPDDAFEVGDDIAAEFMSTPPDGKQRVPDKTGCLRGSISHHRHVMS